MDLVVAHYHFHSGGVVQVVRNQLAALAAGDGFPGIDRVLVVYGDRPDGLRRALANATLPFPLSWHELPALRYETDERDAPPDTAERFLSLLTDQGCRPSRTVVHVHNHSLGKNARWSAAMRTIADAGWPLLLQIHDFAEDGRPANWRRVRHLDGWLYPQHHRIGYAVLNVRDRRRLTDAGIGPGDPEIDEPLLLPNAVVPPTVTARAQARGRVADHLPLTGDRPYLVYPVRAIRRKNLGEVLLWSVLLEREALIAVTLPATSADERPVQRFWRTAAAERDLPVVFDAGADYPLTLADHLGAADAVLTTSVAEGFGMLFVEGPLAGRPVVGRIAGVRTAASFPLYDKLTVPLTGGQREQLRRLLRTAYDDAHRLLFGVAAADEALAALERHKLADAGIDFADLDEALQRKVIVRCVAEPDFRERIRRANPILATAVTALRSGMLHAYDDRGVTDRLVAESAPQATAERLRRSYDSLLDEGREASDCASDTPATPLPGDSLRRSFLEPADFRLIRWAPFEEPS